jgi:hypothetical protein
MPRCKPYVIKNLVVESKDAGDDESRYRSFFSHKVYVSKRHLGSVYVVTERTSIYCGFQHRLLHTSASAPRLLTGTKSETYSITCGEVWTFYKTLNPHLHGSEGRVFCTRTSPMLLYVRPHLSANTMME